MYLRVRRNAVDAKDAREPGYRDAVAAIAVETTDTHYTVPRDAYHALWRKGPTPPKRATHRRFRRRVALGDAVERMLTAMGITKERVQRWTRTKDCGCEARQKWLNQWGFKKQEQFSKAVTAAARVAGFGR